MQICQEKGKHANGPYGMRVRGRVRRKEEVTRVLGGPAPDVFLWRISEGGAGHLYHSAHQPTGNAAHLDVRADPGQRMVSRRPETPVIFERKLLGGIQRNLLKNMIFHPNGGKFETQTASDTPTASVRRRCWGTGREQGHGNGAVVGHRGAYLPSPAAVRCSISQDSGD